MTSALDTRHGEGNSVPMHCNTNFGKTNFKLTSQRRELIQLILKDGYCNIHQKYKMWHKYKSLNVYSNSHNTMI